LRDAGYDVSGKRPDAVFLNQISRSPVVKATTKAGVYELDLEAPKRLSEQLRELQQALSHVAAEVSSGDEELAKRSAEQEQLSLEIRQTQRTLLEATQGLDDVAGQQPNQLAA
jgi:chromosome segregation ATPase